MKLDVYEHCPCGSGKKIKFCCKDLLHELDSLRSQIDGQQYAAAQAHLERLLATQPDRECLLAIQATLLQSLHDEAASKVLDRFLSLYPNNPIALALLAISKAETPDELEEESGALSQAATEAVDALQRSLDNTEETTPQQLYDAVGVVGQRLLAERQFLAAREHLIFQAALSPEDADEALSLVMSIDRTPEVSLLQKQDLLLSPTPGKGQPWEAGYDEVFELGQRGRWGRGLERITELISQYPDVAFLRRGQAVLACRLGRTQLAIEAWTAYSRDAAVDHDEAVEAAALAQLLEDAGPPRDPVDYVKWGYAVEDLEQTLTALQAHPCCHSLTIDPAFANEGNPPPRAGFMILDREVPEFSEDLEVDELPRVVTQILLFGKETDQPARIVFFEYRGELAERTRARIEEITGHPLGELIEETVTSSASARTLVGQLRVYLPETVPAGVRKKLGHKIKANVILNTWPAVPDVRFEGKTPREASDDPSMRIPLEAAILGMEIASSDSYALEDFKRLRESLNLPQPKSPSLDDMRKVPVLKYFRLDPAELNTEDLATCLSQSLHKGIDVLNARFGRELLKRDDETHLKRDQVLAVLARSVDDADEAIGYVQEAQRVVAKRGESPAIWKIRELGMRAVRGEADAFQKLLANLQTNHLAEPGIAQLLTEQLAQLGLLGPTRRGPPPAADHPAAAPPREGAAAKADPEPASKAPSKLWLPGMD